MDSGTPSLIAIDHDDYHARYIGKLPDGRQFFLTTPFVPSDSSREGGCEYVALYMFALDGRLLEAKIDSFGPRSQMDEKARSMVIERRLDELGEKSYERIEVAPFTVQRFGMEFGLIISEPEEEDDPCTVEMQPGNYMAFYEPWDSGDYDT